MKHGSKTWLKSVTNGENSYDNKLYYRHNNLSKTSKITQFGLSSFALKSQQIFFMARTWFSQSVVVWMEADLLNVSLQ